ncbi:helix-turn-helix domain-containing protein [Candidatus Dojkabacteria bacterium]|nr:helix-turn-helix domain-containing protein [Candidatus Dojkabacteria bacterium]
MTKEYLRELREERNLTQSYIARKLGISRQTYVLIEKGERDLTLTKAEELARILGISIDQLVNKPHTADRIIDVSFETIRPKPNYRKYKEILLYILTKIGAKPNIYKNTIFYILYFIDFDYYKKYKKHIIDATYVKKPVGPKPLYFEKLIKKMAALKEIEIIESKQFAYLQKKYLPTRDPNFSNLVSIQELNHIDWVLARLSNLNITEFENYLKWDAPWQLASNNDTLDYKFVFYRNR